MKLNIRERLFVIGLIMSLTIFLTINAVSYWNIKRHIESRANVEKTLVIIAEYENLISMVKDAETGQLGFIITGDWIFLEPYYNGVTAVHRSMKLLRELTPIDGQAYQKLGNIEGMIEKVFEQFHKKIGLRKKGYIAAAAFKSGITAEDEKIMFDIRTLVEELKHEKTDLLQEQNRTSKARSQHTLFTIFFGNLVAFLFVFFSFIQLYRDITERKRAEETLKKSEENYRRLFESSPAAIYQVDFRTGKFLKANDIVCKYFGRSHEEITSCSPYDRLTDESKQLLLERLNKMSLGIKVTETPEYEVIDINGRRWWLQLSSKNIYDSEGFMGADVVAHDITSRKRAEEELRASQQLLRSLAERLEKVREEERVTISREIHDIMGGGLTGLKMDLFWLMHKVENAESDKEQAAMVSRILTSSETVDKMIKVTRRISTELRPPVLDDLGLIAALEWQLSEFTSRTGILHKFTTAFEDVNIERDQSIAVFRIFQETLTNIARHSGATKVIVVLREDGRSISGDENLVIEIRDNGRGIMEEEILNKESLGLLGMKERAMAFGGELSIFGKPGEGTAVVLKIPRKRGEPS